MEIGRDRYLRRLVDRMHNGMVKVVTGIRRCGKTYLLFNLFGDYLRSQGVDDGHIVEVALDAEENAALRDPAALSAHLRSRIAGGRGQYYVFLDEVQYAISREELRDRDAPHQLCGVLNGPFPVHARCHDGGTALRREGQELHREPSEVLLRGCWTPERPARLSQVKKDHAMEN